MSELPDQVKKPASISVAAPLLAALEQAFKLFAVQDALWDTETGDSWTYHRLWTAVGHTAGLLTEVLLDPPKQRQATYSHRQPVVALLIEGGVELVVAWLAALRAGCVVVPLSADDPTERLRALLHDCDAGVALVTAGQQQLSSVWDTSCHTVVVDKLAEAIYSNPAMAVAPTLSPHPALSHIIYTSGTTGQPKGVLCTQTNLLAFCHGKITTHGLRDGPEPARVLLTSAPTWDPAVGDLMSTLLAGAVLCMAPRAAIVHDLAATLQRSRCTHVFATPSLWSLLRARPAELPTLKVVTLGGERIPPHLVAEWAPHVRLLNMYGVTEATVGQLLHHLRPGTLSTLVGQPMGDHTVCLDENSCEILIGGPGVSPGFLNDPVLTAERFVTLDGMTYVRTGDLGRWVGDRASGTRSLEVLGRMAGNKQIKLRGFRVQLDGVEATLNEHALVRAAVALLVDRPAPRLVAFCALTITKEAFELGGCLALQLFCKQRLPHYEVPSQILWLESLPLKLGGKVDHAALHKLYVQHNRSDPTVGQLAVESDSGGFRSNTERIVSCVFDEVLGLNPGTATPLAHFFELGGTSMAAMQMVELLCKRLRDPAVNPTGAAAFVYNADQRKARLCGLQRKPTVRQYASYLDWFAVMAPNRQAQAFDELFESEAKFDLEQLLVELDVDAVQDDAELCRKYLHVAAQAGHASVVSALLAVGTTADGHTTKRNRTHTPLSLAVAGDHVSVVGRLLRAGANPNLSDTNLVNSVHLAAARPYSQALMLLLDAGAAVNPRDINRWTPCMYAAWHGREATLKLLLERGAAADAKDRWSRTPLAWAVFRGHLSCVRCLLEAGAVFNPYHQKARMQPQSAHQRRHNNYWSSLLHLAVQAVLENGASEELVDVLIAGGAPTDALDSHGGTPLHDAAGAALLRFWMKDRSADLVRLRAGSTACLRRLFAVKGHLPGVEEAVDTFGFRPSNYAALCGLTWPGPATEGSKLASIMCDSLLQSMMAQYGLCKADLVALSPPSRA